ncbi:MAG: CBS domain-containing protein [Bacteroidales bacterium]|nr:CBS domain-containing protein [Bacteroidales bacterium]MBN2758383.1 CBS domain-containing protein [Bacteroidales bacterium]
MLAKDLISDVIPIIKTSESGQNALNWMEIFRISHLPIVNNRDYLGLISDSDIYNFNKVEEAIGGHPLSLIRPHVFDYQHIYEVIEIVARLKLSIIPVLDEKNQYLGCISIQDLVQQFATLSSVIDLGGIIVLELNVNDYSLSEISQIVESNDVKILSLYISSHKDSTKLDLTLKLNTTNLAAVIKAFERYDYDIKASFLDDDNIDMMYNDRFDSFMNYLNI